MKQSVEWRSNLYLVFIDFQKAFDTINHEAIWRSLAKRRFPEKIINLIKAFYTEASSQVLHKGKLSNSILIHTGVKQGCVLSPVLFNIILDDILEKVTEEPKGLRWTLNGFLENLDYADDICLNSHIFEQTKSMRVFTNH